LAEAELNKVSAEGESLGDPVKSIVTIPPETLRLVMWRETVVPDRSIR
jgi:hypothetical protein